MTIVNVGYGIISAMPDSECSSAAAPRQVYEHPAPETSPSLYDENNVFQQPALHSFPYRMSRPLANPSAVVVLKLRRLEERFYAAQLVRGRSLGPHVFSRTSSRD